MKVYVETYGCSANFNDSEIMQGVIEGRIQGALTDCAKEADTIIINSCAVKGPTERKILRSIDKNAREGKKIIVSGCMAEAQSKLLLERNNSISIVSPDNIERIGEALISSEQVIIRGKKKLDKASLPRISGNSTSSIIQIAEGCDSACTYCLTKAAKGIIRSMPEESILSLAEKSVLQGKQELWLTSQDNSCFGVDIFGSTRLPRLIKKISRIPGDFMIRNGMGNPNNLVNSIPEIIDAYKSDKVYKFLHLPSQSGSNKVLKEMRRQYSIEEYFKIINAFKENFERMHIANDIIVGYPTETEDDFEQTLELIRQVKPDTVNISRFWPRPGTYASRLKQIEGGIVKERSRKLTSLFENIAERNNRDWIGRKCSMLINETGKNETVKGVNSSYKTIVIKKKELLDKGIIMEGESLKKSIGNKLDVRITSAGTYHLDAKII